ncbi:MAG: tail fiber protein [Saprospiraceae bacterium]|nr:tail fiber protein [Saprospiraceae bacterium]MCF8250899.1 tail fiber protein [Saprospiraceae bacterium]MCF8282714.1 tail fiber protein [Bacteroidales bacterium]MCF8311864.1 tail fiber protein [Saprospiraceae bacterium]MCF8443022.1 tail fiber protein [Saprospiraceae bacterium]
MEPFIGEIKLFAGNFAPRGWAFCDGQLLPINQHQALFSILGTNFGGDGRSTFGLPDLRGRVSVHPGNGPGLSSYRIGEKGGAETVTLTVNQLPSHSHSLNANKGNGNTSDTPGASLADSKGSDRDYNKSGAVDTEMSKNSIGATGGGQPIENRQPYLAINYIIALQGVFPSRS